MAENFAIKQLNDKLFVESLGSGVKNNSAVMTTYPFSNETLKDYIKLLNISGGRVATVGSSGDQAFYAIYNDAESVTLIDACPFAKPIVELKKSAIQNMGYSEFMTYWVKQNMLKPYLYESLLGDVSEDTREFLDYVKSIATRNNYDILFDRIIKSSYMPIIFQTPFSKIPKEYPHLFTCEFYKTEEGYNKLKSKLKDAKIDFKMASLEDFPKELNGEYSTIMLSNVFDYLGCNGMKKEFFETAKALIDNNMVKGGTMQIDYELGIVGFAEDAKNYMDTTKMESYVIGNYKNIYNDISNLCQDIMDYKYPKTWEGDDLKIDEDLVHIYTK